MLPNLLIKTTSIYSTPISTKNFHICASGTYAQAACAAVMPLLSETCPGQAFRHAEHSHLDTREFACTLGHRLRHATNVRIHAVDQTTTAHNMSERTRRYADTTATSRTVRRFTFAAYKHPCRCILLSLCVHQAKRSSALCHAYPQP